MHRVDYRTRFRRVVPANFGEGPVSNLSITVVPVGRLDAEEVEAAAVRVSKVLREPVELRGALPVPHASEDSERRQHRAAMLMGRLIEEVRKLRPGKVVGSTDPEAKAPPRPIAVVFVTDVDMFTKNTDGVFAALISAKKCAVVSVRRLREAFYRRKADPTRQRARLVKEILRVTGRVYGMTECVDPQCVLASSKRIADVDAKQERYCRACEQALFEGRIRI